MKHLNLTFPTPEENLACDEVLLNACEDNTLGDEVLRFWESDRHFVVLGYFNKVDSEVNREACQASGIPIYRRCSGGGTVLQGPGCLNYTLILDIRKRKSIANLVKTNTFVLTKHKKAFESILAKKGTGLTRVDQIPTTKHGEVRPNNVLWTGRAAIFSATQRGRIRPVFGGGGKTCPLFSKQKIEVCEASDLAVNGLKFSGNAQRRKKNFVLFHGTFLLNFDIAAIEQFLKLPTKQPSYRHNRSHTNFLTNLNADTNTVQKVLKESWQAHDSSPQIPLEEIKRLAKDCYSSPEWNLKF